MNYTKSGASIQTVLSLQFICNGFCIIIFSTIRGSSVLRFIHYVTKKTLIVGLSIFVLYDKHLVCFLFVQAFLLYNQHSIWNITL